MKKDNPEIAQALHSKQVLVTGGAGFIGSHLVEAFLEAGAHVHCLDNLATGSMQNVQDSSKDHESFQFIEGDVRDPDTCRGALEGIDLVFHQAALGSVPRSFDDPGETLSSNLVGLAVLYSAAAEAGVKTFTYASSSSVYGDSSADFKREGEEGKPLSPYALSKAAGDMLMRMHTSSGAPIIIGLRYFNVFGPRQHPKGPYAALIPKFTLSLLHGHRPTIYGDGEQTRDFTFVENVVRANVLAAFAPSAAHGQVFNIGRGEATSVQQIYEHIKESVRSITGREPPEPPIMADARQGEPRSSIAEITRAHQVLGYEPQVDVDEGLKRTVRWYADHLGWYSSSES